MTAQPAPKRTFWDVPVVAPDAAWEAKRRLAKLVRELVGLVVTTEAPHTTLGYAADAVAGLVERLAQHPTLTFGQAIGSIKTQDETARFADRGALTGKSNPYAPPVELAMEGTRAVGRVTFGPAFEGIPGHVHGGLVSAVFDQIFGYLQVKSGPGALTAELTVRYKAPTPLLVPLHLEAEVVKVEGRKYFHHAKMLAGETLTAEADGLFVALDQQRMNGIIGRKRET
ncbi:MAG TPA: PaaI family thioesterase [Polyangiaceae bacterium]